MYRRWLPLAFLFIFWTFPAYAYLDPASGSMILQLILGGLAGAAVTIKLFWHRILDFFGKTPPAVEAEGSPEQE